MAYGEPLSALAITGIVAGVTALVGGGVAQGVTAADAKKAEKEKEEAEKAERKAKREQEYQESLARTQSAQAQQLDTEIALRERLHQEKINQSQATTGYVDQYRAQLGLTGDAYDQILSNLYTEERKLAMETQQAAIQREEEEIKQVQGTNYGQIALYSFLGIASVGTLVYLKKRRK
jgi:thiamine pyrophosphokinase